MAGKFDSQPTIMYQMNLMYMYMKFNFQRGYLFLLAIMGDNVVTMQITQSANVFKLEYISCFSVGQRK